MGIIDCHVRCFLQEWLSPAPPFLLTNPNTNLFRDIQALNFPATSYQHPKSETVEQALCKHDLRMLKKRWAFWS